MRELWHPAATIIDFGGIGGFTGGGRKLVWHTVEGSTIEGAVAAYRASGAYPHFTVQWVGGKLRIAQHAPVNEAVTTLRHPGGTPETNRAGAIQVEICGFAKDSQDWPDAMYDALADLSRWIEENAGVPRRAAVKFTVPAKKLSGSEFVAYAGHIGHAHVPHNDHWDPGRLLIDKIIGESLPKRKYASRRLTLGKRGTDVRRLQKAVNKHRRYRRKHGISKKKDIRTDGEYGPQTDRAARRTAYQLGASHAGYGGSGVSRRVQRFIRKPKKRPKAWKVRQAKRRSRSN